jgi:hypothetical protein
MLGFKRRYISSSHGYALLPYAVYYNRRYNEDYGIFSPSIVVGIGTWLVEIYWSKQY